MHDPKTIAFEIKYPWRSLPPDKLFPDGYRDTLITIWHVDPETDGTDDSCGWFYPKLTKNQMERLRAFSHEEARRPYFLRQAGREWNGSRELAEILYRTLVLNVADRIDLDAVSFDEAAKLAARHMHGLADIFCFEPGYHVNSQLDTPEGREDYFLRTLVSIGRGLLREARHWWQHPRWHVWHWKVSVEPLHVFKRWLFSCCATCGRGFSWRDSHGCVVSTGGWGSAGPQWFRPESNLHHMDCYPGAKPMMEVVK